MLALEARELQLYRQASQHASDLVGPAAGTQAWYRQAQRDVEQLRVRNAEQAVPAAEYRQAYRDMLTARQHADQIRQAQRPAEELLGRSRRDAIAALAARGVAERDAERVLDQIDADTALAPPFM